MFSNIRNKVCPVINNDILNNIVNNIDNMPNLQHFSFKCFLKDIEEDIYKNYIRKLLSLKLKYVELIIDKEGYFSRLYTLEELKTICTSINTLNLNKINIRKYEIK